MNNKVYIVTAGSYSDYHIVRCFLDENKAEEYIKISDEWDLNDYIEEYNLDDNLDFKPINYIDIRYNCEWKNNVFKKDKYKFNIKTTNTVDTKNMINNTYYYYGSINIKRTINSNNFNENQLREKYLKVCYDIEKQIKYLIEVEGYSEKMINDWLESQ